MALVEINDIRKSYGSLNVLDGVTLNVDKGQVVAIIGRSGSGKSTLLRCVNGLEPIQAGQIRVGGTQLDTNPEELRKLRQRVGMVFQSYNLFPHLTVLQNLMLAPKLVKKTTRTDALTVAREMLGLVGLADKADSFPDQLSGGQQQRVAIARSLAMQPEVMLFDEVTSALDPELTEEVLKVMEDLAKRGMTMMLVTHEMSFARQVADVVVFMNKGKIWEIGPSEELFAAPKTQELRQFLNSNLK